MIGVTNEGLMSNHSDKLEVMSNLGDKRGGKLGQRKRVTEDKLSLSFFK